MEKLWEHFCNAKLTNFYERKRFCKPSKKFKTELERATVKVNNIIDVIALQCNNITDINHLTYAAAVTSIEIAGLENICLVRRKKKNITKKQQWVINIEQRIMNLRSDISMLDQMNNERPSQKMIKNNNMMATKFNIIPKSCS